MRTKDEFPKFLQLFLIDFKNLFQGWRVCKLRILRSDNEKECDSAKVQQICINKEILLQFINAYEEYQNGKVEKSVGDCWSMAEVSLLFSNIPRFCGIKTVKRQIPCSANEGFKSPLHMIIMPVARAA
jgi:hypothetical protein